MCGIAGILSSNPSLVSLNRLQQMSAAIAHRGPDGADIRLYNNGSAGLAHRRLAIIDLSQAAAQPMEYLQRYHIVHNGEIYNYKELKQTLQQKGYQFSSQSDTEVVLAAFDCYGHQCLEQFEGMFAFAIWDSKEQQLFAARDRFGEKPFFYYKDDDQFLFASEMKALWAAGVEKQVDEQMLYNYLTLGYIQHPGDPARSFYRNIAQLPARHYLVYDLPSQLLSIHQYWDIDARQTDHSITTENAIDRFRELFTQSVSNRLRSDVAVGTSLSGGLDSSSVLATVCELTNTPVHTFSAVFPGFARDESKHINTVAHQLGVTQHNVQPSASDMLNEFEKVCYHQETPFQSSGTIAQFKVFQLAKQHGVTVLLDGQGADETLAGYHKYYQGFWQELGRSNRSLLQQEMQATKELGIVVGWGWKEQLAGKFPSFASAFLLKSKARKQQYHPHLAPQFVEAYGQSHYARPYIDSLNGMLYYNSFLNGLEELLQYADRNSMAHGCEVRLPFLHHQLVEFIFSLPSTLKIRDGFTKWILRKTMQSKLPDSIVWRKDKTGFETPQQQWMQLSDVQDFAQEAKRTLVNRGILQPAVLHKKIQPLEIHAAENFDWRYLAAGTLLR
ncbi:asparagine synthase (glutamine-hydrolyzing) [Pseudoflavitalea rhizosphaerae]|uniref:asparagine synthase (glutamine-hydrolyzing) n=1 Tax=Pseudoflavitalea rhizosphaerae TaxID=1884793 RepID=UPI000F8DD4FD|nr:asparagine synthase (glutamine-hydrolyzing) [Pseudoflavitalea rhizosphaerae]